jgi:hypothetical protein
MASVVQTVAFNGLAGVSSKSVTLSATGTGTSIVVSIAVEGGATAYTAFTVADSKSNVYSLAGTIPTGLGRSAAVYYCLAPTSGVTTVTITGTGGSGGMFGCFCAQEVSGITALDKTNTATTGVASPLTVTNSATNTGTGDFVTTVISVGNGSAACGISDPPSGYTRSSISQNDSADASGATAWRINTSAVTDSVSWAATSWVAGCPAVIASFVGAAAGGTTLSCAAGSYALSGQSETSGIKTALSNGTYAMSGQAAALGSAVVMSANFGSYSMTGKDASLDFSNGATVLLAGAGNYALTGAGAASDLELSVDSGSFSWTGQAATLAVGGGVTLTANSGTYALSGQTSSANISLPLSGGAFSLTGQAASFAQSGSLAAGLGVFGLAGQSAGFTQGTNNFTLSAFPGSFSLIGQPVTVPSSTASGPGGLLSEGHYKRKKKRKSPPVVQSEPVFIAPASIEHELPRAVIERVPEFTNTVSLAQVSIRADRQIEALVDESDDEEALEWILKVLD